MHERSVNSLGLVTLLAVALGVVGCMEFPRQAFDKRANPAMKTIALLEVTPPERVPVVNLGGIGSAFGLLGAAIEESEQERKSENFSATVAERRQQLGRHMMQELTRGLEQNGYRVVVLSGTRPAKKGDDQDADYTGIRTDADAILDVHFARVSYIAPGSDYLPWMLVGASLVTANDKTRLYAQHYSYGNASGPMDEVEHIPSTPEFSYSSEDDLMGRAPEAVSAFYTGATLIADRIAASLR